MEEREKELQLRPEEGQELTQETNHLWTGGSWEHPEDKFPAIPPVVIPERPMEPHRRKRKQNGKRRIPWFAAVIVVVFVCALGLAALKGALNITITMPNEHPKDQYVNESTEPPAIDRVEPGSGLTVTLEKERGPALDFAGIYEKVSPSIVSIEAETESGISGGTGIILSEDGYILTNAHVVAGGEDVQVLLHDRQASRAKLVGFQNDEDLAVLKIEREGLTSAQFGDSALLHPGDRVAALGDPLGYRATITEGIISGIERNIEGPRGDMLMIQTSAPINHGNSGGALINRFGQVVGVTTIKIVTEDGGAEALGFAIPSRRVKYVVDRLIAGEPVEKAVFGFTVLTLPEPKGGLGLIDVAEYSDCYKKGLRLGDVVVEVAGRSINSPEDLAAVKLDLGPGDELELVYRRDDVEHTIRVALVAPPEDK